MAKDEICTGRGFSVGGCHPVDVDPPGFEGCAVPGSFDLKQRSEWCAPMQCLHFLCLVGQSAALCELCCPFGIKQLKQHPNSLTFSRLDFGVISAPHFAE